MWVFGCAWKINFLEILFSWPCVLVGLTRKWFEVKIFTSNHFQTHAQKEREIAPRSRHEPRAQSPSTSTSNCTQIAPFDFASEPRAQIMPSTLPRSHPRIAPRRHRSHQSHWDRNWEMVGFWWIFFGWVLFLCLSIEKWYYIFIWKLRKCEEQEENVFSILFSATQPNTRKYFPKHFLECNQTLENIFLFQK